MEHICCLQGDFICYSECIGKTVNRQFESNLMCLFFFFHGNTKRILYLVIIKVSVPLCNCNK